MRSVDFIICEDLRQEIGNKYSIMGVFADDVRLTSAAGATWPIAMRLGFFVRVALDRDEPFPNKVTLTAVRGETRITLVEGELRQVDPALMVIVAFVLPQFGILAPGPLSFECSFARNGEVLGAPLTQTLTFSLDTPPAVAPAIGS